MAAATHLAMAVATHLAMATATRLTIAMATATRLMMTMATTRLAMAMTPALTWTQARAQARARARVAMVCSARSRWTAATAHASAPHARWMWSRQDVWRRSQRTAMGRVGAGMQGASSSVQEQGARGRAGVQHQRQLRHDDEAAPAHLSATSRVQWPTPTPLLPLSHPSATAIQTMYPTRARIW